MSVGLEPHGEGVVLPVRAQPGARMAGVRGIRNRMLHVSVTEVAEKGKANSSLIEVLARHLSLRKSQIELLAGQTSRQKRFLVRGISMDELAARISAAVAPGETP